MKKTVCFLTVIFMFCVLRFPAFAETNDDFGVGEIENYLDNQTKQILDSNEIHPADPDFVNRLSISGVFSYIFSLFNGELKTPLKTAASASGILLITAALTPFFENKVNGETKDFILCLAAGGVIFSAFSNTLSGLVGAIKTVSGFMIGFIPIFAGLTVASGGAVSGSVMGGILMAAASAVSSLAAYWVLPLTGSYLAISVCSGISEELSSISLGDTVKKAALWGLSFVSSIFLGVLSVQSVVNGTADTVALKTAKFILGTSVPVAGGVLSEAVGTVSASVSLLRSTAGIYAVIAIAVIALPMVIELIIWRLMFLCLKSLGRIIGAKKTALLMDSVDSAAAILLGILLLCVALFIISLSVLLTVFKPS